jgi:hypothetical protein
MGGGDLYISYKDKGGNWTKSKNLGPKINSAGLDYCPYVNSKQNFFLFTSDRTAIQRNYDPKLTLDQFIEALSGIQNGKGNLYWIAANAVIK